MLIPYSTPSEWDGVFAVHGLNEIDRHCKIGTVWLRAEPDKPLRVFEALMKLIQRDRPI